MKITFNGDALKELKNKIMMCGKISQQNTPLPALRNVKISCVPNAPAVLEASNSDTSIRLMVDGEADEAGTFLINSAVLQNIIKNIDSNTENIILETNGNTVLVKAGRTKYSLPTTNVKDWPEIDFSLDSQNIKAANISMAALVDISKVIAVCAATSDTRPVLTGILFEIDQTTMTVRATDSYRLAKKKYLVGDSTVQNGKLATAIVPASVIRLLPTVFALDAKVLMHFKEKSVVFSTPQTVLVCRVLDGGYPATDRLIPAEFNTSVRLNRLQLISAVKRMLFIKTDNIPIVLLDITPNKITISSKNQELGDFVEELDMLQFSGNALHIAMHGQYLLDALNAYNSDEVTIVLNADIKPFLVESGDDPEEAIELLLPIRQYN